LIAEEQFIEAKRLHLNDELEALKRVDREEAQRLP
jgi:hypothetical protein